MTITERTQARKAARVFYTPVLPFPYLTLVIGAVIFVHFLILLIPLPTHGPTPNLVKDRTITSYYGELVEISAQGDMPAITKIFWDIDSPKGDLKIKRVADRMVSFIAPDYDTTIVVRMRAANKMGQR